MLQSMEQRTGSLCSLFSIAAHLCKLMSGRNLEEFIETSVAEILPWTMTQHFSVRVYAQAALSTVWMVAKQQNLLDFCQKHATLKRCFDPDNCSERYTVRLPKAVYALTCLVKYLY